MTIPEICKLHSQNLSLNLRQAKNDEERLQYLFDALNLFAEQVIPPLNELFVSQGKGSQELDSARTVALELTGVICGDIVRKCDSYSGGIFWLDEVSEKCVEPQLKQKLLFYTNQLKKRWNIAEPGGGLSHNPRAKRTLSEEKQENPIANVVFGLFFVGGLLYLLIIFQPARMIFPALYNKPQPASISPPQIDGEQTKPVQSAEVPPPSLPAGESPQIATPSTRAIYSYTDGQGVLHMVDNPDKVPFEYRKDMKVDSSVQATGSITPVIIDGNQVIVPVTISFRGRSVETRLLLDTGATITSISENLASQLGVGRMDTKEGKSTVADGRTVGNFRFKADSLAVANHVLPNADTSILPGTGGKGYEGLLGMNFLKNFRYHVNFNRSVIEWGG